MIWTIFSLFPFSTSSYIIFFCLLPEARYKIPVETHTTLSDYFYTEISFQAKFHTSLDILFLDQRKQWQNSRLPLIWHNLHCYNLHCIIYITLSINFFHLCTRFTGEKDLLSQVTHHLFCWQTTTILFQIWTPLATLKLYFDIYKFPEKN